MPAMPDGVAAPYPELEPCATDADCTEMTNGFCRVTIRSAPEPPSSVCVYPCTSDGDCAAGFVCFCDARGGACIPASCSSDSDCGNEPCILLFTGIQCGTPVNPELFCRTNEGCSADAECGQGMACISGTCTSTNNYCGRPFLVLGTERRANAKTRGDWCKVQAFDAAVLELEPRLRPVLSKHFTESGLMEHASIAAFARFTLELLSLGAPAELVARAARAMADETDHARACFALAARYSGAEVGPSPLSIRGSLDQSDPLSIFSTAFREACVGETLAAMAALEAARRARDPMVRSTLARIAEDEARHAELGWRFAGWMLETSAPTLQARLSSLVRDILATERTKTGRSDSIPRCRADETLLSEHGLLSDSVLASVRDSTLEGVIAPCVDHLLRRVHHEEI